MELTRMKAKADKQIEELYTTLSIIEDMEGYNHLSYYTQVINKLNEVEGDKEITFDKTMDQEFNTRMPINALNKYGALYESGESNSKRWNNIEEMIIDIANKEIAIAEEDLPDTYKDDDIWNNFNNIIKTKTIATGTLYGLIEDYMVEFKDNLDVHEVIKNTTDEA